MIEDLNAIRWGERPDIKIQQDDRIMLVAYRPVFYLFGEVQRPGTFAMTSGELTLRQAIASAGGLKPRSLFGRKPRCEISRRPLGKKPRTRTVDLGAIVADKAPDVIIETNDCLYVTYGVQAASDWRDEPVERPEADRAGRPSTAFDRLAVGVYYMIGHVYRPGAYNLSGQRLTLRRAIAAAGGIDSTATADKLACRIERRQEGGSQKILGIDDLNEILSGKRPDVEIRANDVVRIEPEGGLTPEIGEPRSPTPHPKD